MPDRKVKVRGDTGNCEICGEVFYIKAYRDYARKRFCSHRCKGLWLASLPKESRICKTCSTKFVPKNNSQLFCCRKCVPPHRSQTTDQQYARITDAKSYFKALLCKPERKQLFMEDVLSILEDQEGRCALTGVKLTFKRERGTIFRTNASLDRIVPGGPYIKENIRLVCSIVNKMRLDMSDEELNYWCTKILTPEEL